MASHKAKASVSSGGISVTSTGTARCLRRAGVQVDCWAVAGIDGLEAQIEHDQYRAARPVTHVMLHTPNWDPTRVAELAWRWPDMEFVQLNHSGLAYLDLDHNGGGVKRIRQMMDLQTEMQNVRVAANNPRVSRMLKDAFGAPELTLPNLYYWEDPLPPPIARRDHDPLRIGSFGIGRDWKNQAIAAQASLAIARRLGVSLELHVNIDPWGSYTRVRDGRANLLADLPHAKLVEHPWREWSGFRRMVHNMDLLISPSYDETFCCVCADGIVEGVPSAGSDAMDWLPHSWRCRAVYDHAAIVGTAMGLLHDKVAAIHDGRHALAEYVTVGTKTWIDYLTR